MAVENIQAFLGSMVNWTATCGDCLPHEKYQASDLDGRFNRNGVFLEVEHKNPGVPLKKGQILSMEASASQGNTCLVIWGMVVDGFCHVTEMQVWLPGGKKSKKFKANVELFRRFVRTWWDAANRLPFAYKVPTDPRVLKTFESSLLGVVRNGVRQQAHIREAE